MSQWRKYAIELFPEDSGAISADDRFGLGFLLSDKLVQSLQSADYSCASKIIKYVLWLYSHSKKEESFLYFAQDVLRETVIRENLRSELWKSVADGDFELISTLCSGILQRDATKDLEREFRFTVR